MLEVCPGLMCSPMRSNASGDARTSSCFPSGEKHLDSRKGASRSRVSAFPVTASMTRTASTVVGRFSRRERGLETRSFRPSAEMSSRWLE